VSSLCAPGRRLVGTSWVPHGIRPTSWACDLRPGMKSEFFNPAGGIETRSRLEIIVLSILLRDSVLMHGPSLCFCFFFIGSGSLRQPARLTSAGQSDHRYKRGCPKQGAESTVISDPGMARLWWWTAATYTLAASTLLTRAASMMNSVFGSLGHVLPKS